MNFFNSELSDEQRKHIEARVFELLSSSTETISIAVIDLCGHIIASSRKLDDPEMKSFSKYAFELFERTNVAARQMKHDKLEQIVASTNQGYVVIVADFGAGILASLSKAVETNAVLEQQ